MARYYFLLALCTLTLALPEPRPELAAVTPTPTPAINAGQVKRVPSQSDSLSITETPPMPQATLSPEQMSVAVEYLYKLLPPGEKRDVGGPGLVERDQTFKNPAPALAPPTEDDYRRIIDELLGGDKGPEKREAAEPLLAERDATFKNPASALAPPQGLTPEQARWFIANLWRFLPPKHDKRDATFKNPASALAPPQGLTPEQARWFIANLWRFLPAHHKE